MKIGVVTAGNENLTLFKFLNKFDHQYHIYYDQLNWPYGDNDFDESKKKIESWIKYLINKWVDKIILSPVYELDFIQAKKYKDKILPIFSGYLDQIVLPSSLVWKIWLFWNFADMQVAQKLMEKYSENFKLTENQKKIKKFNFPFKFWCKEVQMWQYFARKLSFSSLMTNRIIKFDLRYFKDANVDTLIPFDYWYFNYQKTIVKFFNQKKQKFHKIEKLGEVFDKLDLEQDQKYSVNMYVNWHKEFVEREKRVLWNLQKWKNVELVFEKI